MEIKATGVHLEPRSRRYRTRQKAVAESKKGGHPTALLSRIGAGNQIRTGDPHLGKVMLYQLSYARNKL